MHINTQPAVQAHSACLSVAADDTTAPKRAFRSWTRPARPRAQQKKLLLLRSPMAASCHQCTMSGAPASMDPGGFRQPCGVVRVSSSCFQACYVSTLQSAPTPRPRARPDRTGVSPWAKPQRPAVNSRFAKKTPPPSSRPMTSTLVSGRIASHKPLPTSCCCCCFRILGNV